MKALGRAALVGSLAIALAGLGLPLASITALAGSAAPVITNLTLTPNPSNEGQQVVLHGDFTDADGPEEHFLVVNWGGQLALTQQSIPAGAFSFDVLKVYPDDRPTNTPSDTYDVVVILYDGSGPDPSMPNTSQTLKHTVNDVAPDVHVDLSQTTIIAGDSVSATLWFTDPGIPDTFTETFDWGDGSPLWTQPTLSNVKSYSFAAHTFALAGTYYITGTARDDDTLTGTKQVRLTVNAKNTPPTALLLSVTTVVEGDPATLTGSFTDPDVNDAHSVLVSWGDTSTDTTVPVDAGLLTFSTTHVYANHGDYTLTATVTDAANDSTSSTAPVTVLVRNHPPVDLALSATTVLEGDPTTLSGSFSDPDTLDTHSVLVKWGDGSSDTVPVSAGVLTFSVTHIYPNNGSDTVTATVTDPSNAAVSNTVGVIVLVRNHAPANLALTADAIVEGGTATLSGTFTDVDAADTHTVVIDWADGSPQTLSLAAGVTTFSATHDFATAGTYTLGATVTDSHDASTSGSLQLTVGAKSLSDLLDSLRALITSWNLEKGTENSLLAKVDSARANVSPSNVCSSLNPLGNEVSAQTDKKLSMAQVADFWTLLTKVEAAVPCSPSYTVAAPKTPQRSATRHN